MNTLEQDDVDSLKEIISTPGPCITVALAGNESGGIATELKDAIRAIRRQLQTRGVEEEELLSPFAGIAANIRGPVIILRSPSIMRVNRVPWVRPIVKVGDRFDVRTVLTVHAAQKSFYLLALSQNRTRLLKCTEDSSEEVAFPAGFPTSLAEAMQTRQPDHVLDNWASGGPSIGTGSVMFGTSSDRDDKDEYLLHFFVELDKGVNALLRQSRVPLIPVGVEHEIALYGRVNTYQHLLDPGVQGAPDGLEGGEMHRRALQLLDQRSQEPGQGGLADFDKRVGMGRASIHVHEIVVAAYEGRVSNLFFQMDAVYVGTYDPARQRVKRTDDPLDSPVDLIDAAAIQTILQGGEAGILPASAMPNGVPVCALFRYATVQKVAGAGAVETGSEG
jgi:Bacterial archaeo-eukaryotic release factor family 3